MMIFTVMSVKSAYMCSTKWHPRVTSNQQNCRGKKEMKIRKSSSMESAADSYFLIFISFLFVLLTLSTFTHYSGWQKCVPQCDLNTQASFSFSLYFSFTLFLFRSSFHCLCLKFVLFSTLFLPYLLSLALISSVFASFFLSFALSSYYIK